MIARDAALRLVMLLLALGGASSPASAQGDDDRSRAGPDGPYVQRAGDGGLVSIRLVAADGGEVRVERVSLPSSAPAFELALQPVAPPLRVQVRGSAVPPSSRWPQPERVFVISDLEGNLPALVGLLRACGVVDERLEWTFGAGHFVFLGDLFDRGLHVTECLWILYELEARARAHGGEVHFVLGNHEVMNLTGDLRYVRRKYHENAAKLGRTAAQLHDHDTVLGQWLRTRNVALQLGDELYVHGGISPAVVAAGLQIDDLNAAMREGLARRTWSKPEAGALLLAAGSPDGVVWYRGYLKPPVLAESEMDAVLRHLGVARVVVGHTIVENIGFALGGRVLAVDVRHAKGRSQGALRTAEGWWRVSAEGQRVRL